MRVRLLDRVRNQRQPDHQNGAPMKEDRSSRWGELRQADRISFVAVGVGIIIVNVILIALLF